MPLDRSACGRQVKDVSRCHESAWVRARAGAVIAAAFILFVLWPFHSPPAAAQVSGDVENRLLVGSDGVLRLGFREDAAPFSYCAAESSPCPDGGCVTKTEHCPAGDLDGYSIRLCDHIYNRLRAQGKVRDHAWVAVSSAQEAETNRFKLLNDDKVDLLCGATTVTLERMRDHRTSLYTFLSGASVLHPLRQPVDGVKDLEGLKVGVLQGTTTETMLERAKQRSPQGGHFDVVELESHAQVADRLSSSDATDRIDVYFADREILLWIHRDSRLQNKFVVSSRYYSFEPYALFVAANDPALQHEVNVALTELFADRKLLGAIVASAFGKAAISDLLQAMFRIQRIPER